MPGPARECRARNAVTACIDLLAKAEKRRDDPWLDCLRFLTSLTGKDLERAADWKAWSIVVIDCWLHSDSASPQLIERTEGRWTVSNTAVVMASRTWGWSSGWKRLTEAVGELVGLFDGFGCFDREVVGPTDTVIADHGQVDEDVFGCKCRPDKAGRSG